MPDTWFLGTVVCEQVYKNGAGLNFVSLEEILHPGALWPCLSPATVLVHSLIATLLRKEPLDWRNSFKHQNYKSPAASPAVLLPSCGHRPSTSRSSSVKPGEVRVIPAQLEITRGLLGNGNCILWNTSPRRLLPEVQHFPA